MWSDLLDGPIGGGGIVLVAAVGFGLLDRWLERRRRTADTETQEATTESITVEAAERATAVLDKVIERLHAEMDRQHQECSDAIARANQIAAEARVEAESARREADAAYAEVQRLQRRVDELERGDG